MYRMDTAVRVAMLDLRQARAARVKKLRWSVLFEEWQVLPRDSRIDARFWTVLQASFYESYRVCEHKLFPHRVMDCDRLSAAAGGADIRSHFAHFRGLPELLEMEQN